MQQPIWRQAATTTLFTLGVSLAAVCPLGAGAQEKPQYGGTLETSTITPSISVLTWEPADWNWKLNMDTGQVYEQLFAADLSKAKRLGGKFPFTADAWVPPDAMRGELAQSWEWKDKPMRLEVKLRPGVMFAEKPGVMKARELVADDVVYSYNYMNKSPKRISDVEDRTMPQPQSILKFI